MVIEAVKQRLKRMDLNDYQVTYQTEKQTNH